MKFKIFTTLSFICLSIMLTLVGIWAVTDLDFSVGGDITYTAPEKQGFSVTFDLGHQTTIYEINIYINGEKVLSGDQSVLKGKSFIDVYEIKIEVIDCLNEIPLSFVRDDNVIFSTIWDDLIIEINRNSTFRIHTKTF